MIDFFNQLKISNNLVELYDNLKEKNKMLSMFEQLFSILSFYFLLYINNFYIFYIYN